MNISKFTIGHIKFYTICKIKLQEKHFASAKFKLKLCRMDNRIRRKLKKILKLMAQDYHNFNFDKITLFFFHFFI